MRVHFFILLVFLLANCDINAQAIKVVKFEQLKSFLHPANDTLYVINFWATWCKPCVAELPHFTKAAKQLINEKVQFIMVNLDYQKNLVSTVIPFLKKNSLPGQQFLLDETKYNEWIPLVNEEWGGAIPVTLFSNSEKQVFLERDIKEVDELLNIIKPLLSK